ncbi:hypothetical protein DENSPDRAFT_849513 [Dentipellis sp. KUC8613]|nr:hypothetical protein DENSPDRAFT_849513 [Dentipellis sp. KUC8613]
MTSPLPVPTIVTTIEQYLRDAPIPSRVHAALNDCTLDRLPDTLLKTCTSPKYLRTHFGIFEDGKGGATLTLPVEEGSMPEEAVLEVSGVLLKVDLPPITSRDQLPQDRLSFASQSITIGGLGDDAFANAVMGIHNIHTLFSTRFSKLQAWQPERHLEHASLPFASRYITSQKVAGSADHLPFDHAVDPRGVLASALRGKGFHLEDNQVVYLYGKKGKHAGHYSFGHTAPGIFQVGHIVHVQVAFVVVPSTNGKMHHMIPKLRSIALMDASIRDDFLFALSWSRIVMQPEAPRMSGLKRFVGYGGDNSQSKRSKPEGSYVGPEHQPSPSPSTASTEEGMETEEGEAGGKRGRGHKEMSQTTQISGFQMQQQSE